MTETTFEPSFTTWTTGVTTSEEIPESTVLPVESLDTITTSVVPLEEIIPRPVGSFSSSLLGRRVEDLARMPDDFVALEHVKSVIYQISVRGPELGLSPDAEALWNHYGGPLLLWLASRDPATLAVPVLRLMAAIDLHASSPFSERSEVSSQLDRICSAHTAVITKAIRDAHVSAWKDRHVTAFWTEERRGEIGFVAFTAHADDRCKAVFASSEMMGVVVMHRVFKKSMSETVFLREVEVHPRRENVLETSLDVLEMNAALLRRLGVQSASYVGEAAMGEGVVRDWIGAVSREVMDPTFGLFESVDVDDGQPYMTIRSGRFGWDMIRKAKAFGVFMGIAVSHQHAPGFELSVMLYAKLIGAKVTLEDIKPYEPEIYTSMKLILDAGSVDDFPVGEIDVGSETYRLTMENREAVVNMRINDLVQESSGLDAIKEGFFSIVPREQWSGVSGTHLRDILAGLRTINVRELKEAFVYDPEYAADHRVIILFWEAVEQFDQADLSRLVLFISGMTHLPLGGIAALPKRFRIHPLEDVGSLPRAHTCSYTIDLPAYPNYDVMSAKLLCAIRETVGGEMLMA